MHQPIQKKASPIAKVKKVDDLVDIIRTFSKGTGASPKSLQDSRQAAKEILLGRGKSTGSIFGDLGTWSANKVTGKHMAGEKIRSGVSKARMGLADADIRAGSSLKDILSKSRYTKGMGKVFDYKHSIPVGDQGGDIAKQVVVNVPKLSAPFEKTKDVVLPMAGAMYISSKILPEDTKKGGDKVLETNKPTSDNDVFKKKVAEKLESATISKTAAHEAKTGDSNLLSIMKKASCALAISAKKQREMEDDILKLASENIKLNSELLAIKRNEEVEQLVGDMIEKSMISRMDAEDKKAELINMSEEAFSAFKKAVDIVKREEKIAGADSLTFLMGSNNIENRKKTFLETFDRP
jgi:hypothetical protein